jgi:hypothetical protein
VYNNAIQLQHESYRDGVKGGGQAGETVQAARAHTEMALRMFKSGEQLDLTENLIRDMVEYVNGDSSSFNAYVDNNYDSSGDYWKLVKTEDGRWKWDYDKSADFDISAALNDPEFKKNGAPFTISSSVYGNSLLEALNLSQYKDGKEQGVISAGRMNMETIGSLASRLIPFDLTPTQILGGLEFIPESRWKSNVSRKSFINNTLDAIQYNVDHTTTIWNDKNQPITLWNIDSANARRVTLLSQSDPLFNNIPGMASGGCNFMVILAAAQIMTGETLSSGQIKNIWNNAVASSFLVDDGEVQSRNEVANMALSQLGRSDIGISMDDTFKSSGTIRPDSALLGRRIKIPYGESGGSHYILGVNTSNDLTVSVYNPGQTKKDLYNPEVEIWAYAKKKK